MVEGRRFAQNELLELMAWQASKMLSPYVEKGKSLEWYDLLGREPKQSKEDEEALEAERIAKMRLWRKIETAQIARREVVGTFNGRGK